MKLKIKEKDGFGLSLWLPTSIIKSKLFLRIIRKSSDNNNVKIYLDVIPTIYKSLRKYIKENGHFVLVDITSSDGDTVYIKV